MQDPRRAEARVKATLPVSVEGGAAGITRDLCPSGVFFETDAVLELGAPVQFSIEFERPQGTLRLDCRGAVARVEDRHGQRGVAARILEFRWTQDHKAA
jgi:hypothetical protein